MTKMDKLLGLILILVALLTPKPTLAEALSNMSKQKGYVSPFKMFDNLYYVGDQWVSAYLLVTKRGLVLIDTLDMPYSKWIPENIKKLGFEPNDIAYIVITHPHSDHVAGAGYLQKLYNAKVIMDASGINLLDSQSAKHHFIKPQLDILPKDGEQLDLLDNQITFYHTPGHTQGCMSLDFAVLDKGQKYRAFVVCGNGTNFTGKSQTLDYIHSVNRIEKLINTVPRVSVNLATHPHLGQIFSRRDKLNNRAKINPFIDVQGLNDFIVLLQQRGRKKLDNITEQ